MRIYTGRVIKEVIIVQPRNAEAQIEVVALNLNNNQQRLTDNPVHDDSPRWSADGKKITFMSRRDGNHEVYIMDAEGRNQRNLTNHPAQDLRPNGPLTIQGLPSQITRIGTARSTF